MQTRPRAVKALASVRAWLDLITVLSNLGTSDDTDAVQFLAQAVWLVRRVEAPIDNAVQFAAAFQRKLGDDAEAAPVLHGVCTYLPTRGLISVWASAQEESRLPRVSRAFPAITLAIVIHALFNAYIFLKGHSGYGF